VVRRNCVHDVPTKRLYSIKELVKEIGATEWFWRTQIWDGQLPYVQVGRKMLIDREDVESFIQKHKAVN
jgi:excisionase family DNA binding protein